MVIAHATPPPLPPPARVAIDRARDTWRAAGDRATSKPGVAWDAAGTSATLVQGARSSATRSCPRPLPGLPGWRQGRAQVGTVLCVLAYRNDSMRVRVEYRRTPATQRAAVLVRVVVV